MKKARKGFGPSTYVNEKSPVQYRALLQNIGNRTSFVFKFLGLVNYETEAFIRANLYRDNL